jgi:phosphate/phosphite/phosphonate ABC transporter binding protein
MASAELTVFGYVAGADASVLRKRFVRFAETLSKLTKKEVPLFEASTYDELARAVVAGYVDFAWLPPIPFLSLDGGRAVTPLVHLARGGRASYESVLVVARDSSARGPADLVGARAAWVDPESASGFVVPRVALAARGVDPRTAFREERFFRSHEAVVRAVAAGRADFGATYAGFDSAGMLTRGPWLDLEGAAEKVRVLERVGDIPGDIVAARASLDRATGERLLQSLLEMSRHRRTRLLASDAFGVDEFRPFAPAGYDELRRIVDEATAGGLLVTARR